MRRIWIILAALLLGGCGVGRGAAETAIEETAVREAEISEEDPAEDPGGQPLHALVVIAEFLEFVLPGIVHQNIPDVKDDIPDHGSIYPLCCRNSSYISMASAWFFSS